MKSSMELSMLAVLISLVLIVSVAGKPSGNSDAAGSTTMRSKHYEYSGRFLPQKVTKNLKLLRTAGLHGDRSQIPLMISNLEHPAHPIFPPLLMRALVRLAATEALPAVESYIGTEEEQKNVWARLNKLKLNGTPSSYSEINLSNYAEVIKARIIAESSTRGITDSKSHVAAKVRLFYKELALSPADINTELMNSNQPEFDTNGRQILSWPAKPSSQYTPTVVYAIAELADMIYHDEAIKYASYASLTEVTQVNFQADYPSALKIRFAALPREQRVNVLIDDLAHNTVLREESNYEIQLAIDEGLAASQAAGRKLQQMHEHGAEYSNAGYSSLIRVISGVGDRSQVTLIKQLIDEHRVHAVDNIYNDLVLGNISDTKPDY